MEIVKGNRLSECETAISNGKKDSVLGFLRIGQALAEIRDNDLWRFSPAKNLVEYMESVQNIKRSWGYALMGVFEILGPPEALSDDFKTIDVTRCVRLIPHLTEDNKEELLHMAINTPASAFDANVRNLQNKPAPDECNEHDWVVIRRCKTCGLRIKHED